MTKDTYWAIRRREIAKADAPVVVKKPKKAKAKKAKAKKAKAIAEELVIEPEVSDADVTVDPA
jgi:hypothetical protein